jgi:acetylornithine deacetylase
MVFDSSALDAAIDRGAERAFAFLSRLISAPSTVGSEGQALEVFATELEGMGFQTGKIFLPSDIGADPRAGVAQSIEGDRYDVLATLGPTSGPSLLLNGHIDVVPADSPQRWSSPPFEPRREGQRLFGRGAGDMKCGFAMGTLALRALLEVFPQFLTGPLSFLAVIEEECTGNGTLAPASQGVLADAVVLLEPTDLDIMLGGVGVMWCDIDVVGHSTHAESAHLAINPVDLVYRLVEGLRRWSDTLRDDYPDAALASAESPYNLNIGHIHAGDWPSSVPAEATVRLRVGFPRAWSPDDAEREIRTAVAAIVNQDGGFPVEPLVRLSGFRAPGYLLADDHPLTRAMVQAHAQAHGVEPRTFAMGSTTDARIYLNYFDVPALCYGPAASNIHGIDESVDLDSLVAGARTLARFLVNWYAPKTETDDRLTETGSVPR